MANSNFQDLVVLNSASITFGAATLVIGTDAGSKSLIFAQDPAQARAIFLVASNPTAKNTISLSCAGRTIGLINAFVANGYTFSNGSLSVQGSSGLVLSANFATITAGLSRLSALSLGEYVSTIQLTNVAISTTLAGVATSTMTASSAVGSAIRMCAEAPMNVTYLDPLGQQQFKVSFSNSVGTLTLSASVTWFAGVYTFNGSTASTLSTKTASTSISLSAAAQSSSTSTVIDGRFTNITWSLSASDYLLVIASSIEFSMSRNSTTPTISFGATAFQTWFGATHAQVSYSVPYFDNGSISATGASIHLTNIGHSGGTGATSVSPRIHLVGS